MREETTEFVGSINLQNNLASKDGLTNKNNSFVHEYRSIIDGEMRIDDLEGWWKIFATDIQYADLYDENDSGVGEWDNLPEDSLGFNDIEDGAGADYPEPRLTTLKYLRAVNHMEVGDLTGKPRGSRLVLSKSITRDPIRVAANIYDKAGVNKSAYTHESGKIANNSYQKGYTRIGFRKRTVIDSDLQVTSVEEKYGQSLITFTGPVWTPGAFVGYHLVNKRHASNSQSGYDTLIVDNGNDTLTTIDGAVQSGEYYDIVKYENEISIGIWDIIDGSYGYSVQKYSPADAMEEFENSVKEVDVDRNSGWRLFEVVYKPNTMMADLYIDNVRVVSDIGINLSTGDIEAFIEGGLINGLVRDITGQSNTAGDYAGYHIHPKMFVGKKTYRVRHESSTPNSTDTDYPDGSSLIYVNATSGVIPMQVVYASISGSHQLTSSVNSSIVFDAFPLMEEESQEHYLVVFDAAVEGSDYQEFKIVKKDTSDGTNKTWFIDGYLPVGTYDNYVVVKGDLGNEFYGTIRSYGGSVIFDAIDLVEIEIHTSPGFFNDTDGVNSASIIIEEWDSENEEWKTIDSVTISKKYKKAHYRKSMDILDDEMYMYAVRSYDVIDSYASHKVHIHEGDHLSDSETLGYSDVDEESGTKTSIPLDRWGLISGMSINNGTEDFKINKSLSTHGIDICSLYDGTALSESQKEGRPVEHFLSDAVIESGYDRSSKTMTTVKLPLEVTGLSNAVGAYLSLDISSRNITDKYYVKVSIFKSDGTSFDTRFENIIIRENNQSIDLSGIDMSLLDDFKRIVVKFDYYTDGYETPYIDSFTLNYNLAGTVSSFTSTKTSVTAGEIVVFDVVTTHPDKDAEIVEYQYDFDDGNITGWVETSSYGHVYTRVPGTGTNYIPKVRVKDSNDVVSDWFDITDPAIGIEVLNAAPVCRAFARPIVGYNGVTSVIIDASNSFDQNTNEVITNGIKEYDFDLGIGEGWVGWQTAPTIAHVYTGTGEFIIKVRVRDYQDVESEKSLKVIIIGVPVPVDLSLFNRAEELQLEYEVTASEWEVIDESYTEIDMGIPLREYYTLSGMGIKQEGLDDIATLKDVIRNKTLIKILWRDVSRLGYDTTIPEGNQYMYGYITKLSISREGGEKDQHPWQINVVRVDMSQFG